MRTTMLLFGILLLTSIGELTGCMGKPVPLSAQRGSTVVIPVGWLDAGAVVGYESLAKPQDAQRGKLVFTLRDTPGGPEELITRGVGVASAHPASASARGGVGYPNQVVALVDIPDDGTTDGGPTGSFHVNIERQYTDVDGVERNDQIEYDAELKILPKTITVSGEDVVGEPTPYQWGTLCGAVEGCAWGDIVNPAASVPDPELRIDLGIYVSAIELEATYPAGVIDVVDSFETPHLRLNHRAVVWVEDDGEDNGQERIVVNAVRGQADFKSLSVVFVLEAPGVAILDPADVQLSVRKAWDENGVEVIANPTVTGIF